MIVSQKETKNDEKSFWTYVKMTAYSQTYQKGKPKRKKKIYLISKNINIPIIHSLFRFRSNFWNSCDSNHPASKFFT